MGCKQQNAIKNQSLELNWWWKTSPQPTQFYYKPITKTSKESQGLNAEHKTLNLERFLVLMHWTLMRERSDILAVLFRNRRSSIDNNKCQLYLRGLRPVGKGGKRAIPPYFSRSKSKTFSLIRLWITARPRLPDFQTFLRPLIWYAEHFASSWELRVAHFLHSICNIMAFSVHIWLIRINVKKSRSLLYCLSYWRIRNFKFISPSVRKIQSKFQNAALWLVNRNDF